MAEHLRHLLARSGALVRPSSIQTIAGFLDAWAPLAEPPTALVHLAMERTLAKQRPARFARVAGYPGVTHALVGLFGQVSGSRMPDDIGRLFAEVEAALGARGFAPRHARMKAAAERIAAGDEPLPPAILWHGFFKMSAGESLLAQALAQRVDFTISLPEARLTGFEELRIVPAKSSARTVLFRAATIEREVEEIARRILEVAGNGRPFHEMGIVLRSRDPYGPLVETTLARFGIPARGYFIDPLASHPIVSFLSTLVRAGLSGWDHEILLRALRMPASGLGATQRGDELDFALRQELPAQGWHETAGLNAHERLEPSEWASRLRDLRSWLPPLAVEDRASLERISAWRTSAVAVKGWDEAIGGTAEAFQGSRITLAEFWKQVETVLTLEPLRLPDARRNVVHVLDAHEARQWTLPVVFVCGLTERHFPKYHQEDPIVGDEVLRRAGLDTAKDREREERFLFDLAISRATVETVLSYPRFDEAGQNTLPSFFLPDLPIEDVETVVRPQPSRTIPSPGHSRLHDEKLAGRHRRLSASSIETYLQCPFKFFAMKTLRLRERPEAPRDRLNFLLQGNIIHDAFARWTKLPLLGEGALEDAFNEACREKHVPHTYRTEAVRLELLRHFEAFIRDAQVVLTGWSTSVEEKFEFALYPGLTLSGRIDRMDVDARNRALVVDYKYSAGGKLKDRIEASVSGDAVQAGVYLLATERHFKMKPAGMLFCHVKKGVKWDGWHSGIPELRDTGEARTEFAFRELADQAEQTVLRVHGEIVSGRIDVAPSDESKCVWCECRDICRVETIARAEKAGA